MLTDFSSADTVNRFRIRAPNIDLVKPEMVNISMFLRRREAKSFSCIGVFLAGAYPIQSVVAKEKAPPAVSRIVPLVEPEKSPAL
jgi:hypothetical protein